MTPRAGLSYGLMGLPLAFVALPLYVHLPHLYASGHGLSLATVGAVLLAARWLDAVTDPWLGRWVDGWFDRSPRRVLHAAAWAAAGLALGMALVLFPPWPVTPWALLAVLVACGLAYSVLVIAHQAWGARLGGDDAVRARVVAWREGAGLVGVVCASVLPSVAGWPAWWGAFAVALVAGWWAWRRAPSPSPLSPAGSQDKQGGDDLPQTGQLATQRTPAKGWGLDRGAWQAMVHPWRHAAFRRLMGVFVVNGMASAIPATLVLFFVQDRLQAPALAPLFLSVYFVAGALSLPVWTRAVARWGMARAWWGGMGLAVAVFVWAAGVQAGDVWAFGAVCALSGVALGADLALPSALLAGVVAKQGDAGQREGAYFGWWNLASKLNLALAAGLALPLLQGLGYEPGTSDPAGLQALTWAYAVLPCGLKLLAGALWYVAEVRPRPPLTSSASSA